MKTIHMLLGTRDAFRTAMHRLGLTGTIQTAFVERLNLTLRESIATLSRRTWSIAHSLETLRWSIEWGRAYYHFVRPHHSLTVVMAEKLIRGDLQGARVAVECGLPWKIL